MKKKILFYCKEKFFLFAHQEKIYEVKRFIVILSAFEKIKQDFYPDGIIIKITSLRGVHC